MSDIPIQDENITQGPSRSATWPRITVEIPLIGETSEAIARRWLQERFGDLRPSIEVYESFKMNDPKVVLAHFRGPVLWAGEAPREF